MSDALDLSRLMELAQRATPGPWHSHGKPHLEAVRLRKEAAGVSSRECLIYSTARDYVCLPETFARQLATAEFIAACSPDVILHLVQLAAETQQIREERDALKRENDIMLMAEDSPLDKLPGLDALTDALANPDNVAAYAVRCEEAEARAEQAEKELAEARAEWSHDCEMARLNGYDDAKHQAVAETLALREALELAAKDTCSLHCPSIKNTGEEWTHTKRCQKIQQALQRLTTASPRTGEAAKTGQRQAT